MGSTPLYRLERLQLLPRPREEVFAFFAEAANLELLTPDFLRFRILTPQPIRIQEGTQLDYRLYLFRLPLHWQSRIDTFDPPRRFTDRQLIGPYHHWHHVHEFFAVSEGTLVRDQVDYALPYGPVGRLVHACGVQLCLKRIFDYRYQRLAALFPPHTVSPS